MSLMSIRPVVFVGLFLGLGLGFGVQSTAWSYVGAVSSATAEAGRASIEATDSPFMNPASIAFLRGYFFTAGVANTGYENSARAESLALSITDNMPDTIIPTSVGYLQSKTDFASSEQAHRDFRLSFGNFYVPKLAMGLGLKYSDDQMAEKRDTQTNLDWGFLWGPNANLGIALVFENILGAARNIPQERRLEPQSSLGLSYIYKKFARFRLDALSASGNNWGKPTLAGGIESYMNQWFILRIGAQRRQKEAANAYSAGIGFAGPKLQVHYAYFVSPDLEDLTRHSVDLAIPIW